MDLLMELEHEFEQKPFYRRVHKCGGCRKRSLWCAISKCNDCALYCHTKCLTPELTGNWPKPTEDERTARPDEETVAAVVAACLSDEKTESQGTAEESCPEMDAATTQQGSPADNAEPEQEVAADDRDGPARDGTAAETASTVTTRQTTSTGERAVPAEDDKKKKSFFARVFRCMKRALDISDDDISQRTSEYSVHSEYSECEDSDCDEPVRPLTLPKDFVLKSILRKEKLRKNLENEKTTDAVFTTRSPRVPSP